MADEAPGDSGGSQAGLATWLLLGLALVVVLGLFSVRCTLGPNAAHSYAARTLPPEPQPVLLPPPEMNDEYVPCSDCHEDEPTNREPRELEDEHDETVLDHGDLWCLRCHDVEERDSLKLSNGDRIDVEDSWQLCTQCHGQRLEEWQAGVHGKRTGHWWGPKEVWTCVACHDPHAPQFAPIEPKPPPTPPDEIVWQSGREPQETTDEEQ